MKKLLLLLFSLTLCVDSYGEWVYIDKESNSDTEVYVLTDSIEIEDGYVYWTYLNNYSKPRSEYNIMGVAIFRGAECENNRYINIESQMFQGSMGTKSFGERLKPEQEWTTPSSGQIDEKIFNYVCDYINNVEPPSKEVEEDKTTDGIYKCQMTSHVVAFQEREGQEQNSIVSENFEFYFQKQNNTIFIDHGTSAFYEVKMNITESGKAEYNNMDFFEAQFGANKLVYFYPNNRLAVPNKGLFLYSSLPRNLWEGVGSIIATCSLGKF